MRPNVGNNIAMTRLVLSIHFFSFDKSFSSFHFSQNVRVGDVLYNSKWYTYEVKYQKDILFALNIFQNAKSISVCEIYPLNFETGLQV